MTVETTASFDQAEVCVTYDDSNLTIPEQFLRIVAKPTFGSAILFGFGQKVIGEQRDIIHPFTQRRYMQRRAA